jgi:LAO/AO transport system kinase
VLRAAFPWTLVETVGVGQSEIDVASLADSVVLVLQPGSGDTLQFMKAGILEIPDLFVVHKWDLGAPAERARSDLEAVLGLLGRPGGSWLPPVIGASAQTGVGLEELVLQIGRHQEHLAAGAERSARRSAARTAWALELFTRRYGSFGLEQLGGGEAARAFAGSAPGSALEVFSALATRAGLERSPRPGSSRAAARRTS